MKKVINGKRYNTESARYIGEYNAPYATNDFNWYCETLYLKQTGEFFLHGEGNALTRYAEQYIDGVGYGEKLMPLTDDEARKWVEENLEVDVYDELFGEGEEEKNKTFSLLLPESIYDRVKALATESDRTMKDIIVEKLREL